MRDVLLVVVFGVGVLFALRNPFVGLLLYFWISVMNPHRFSWGFAYHLPLAMIASLVTLIGVVLHWDEVKFPTNRESILFVLLWVYVTITTTVAMYPDEAWKMWGVVNKIFLMSVVAMLLITTRKRLLVFMTALVLFVGILGVKGALFGLRSGGKDRVWGPPESFLADNNSFGLAAVMIVPLAFALRPFAKKKWQSMALLAIGWGTIVSALLTYSRGALVGLVVVGVSYFLASKSKIRLALAVGIALAIGMSVMPQSWFNRMSTIQTYEKDESANMRLNSWHMSFNLAKDNPLGGGFGCFTMENYYRYAPDPELGRTHMGGASTAHSFLFEVLAMHGFGGVAIYLTTIVLMLWSLRRIEVQTREWETGAEVSQLARGLGVSIIGFLACAAFQSRAFFDLFWSIFVCAVCLKHLVVSGRWVEEQEPVSEPRPRIAAAVPRMGELHQ